MFHGRNRPTSPIRAGPILGLHFLDRREAAERNARIVLRQLKTASANGGG